MTHSHIQPATRIQATLMLGGIPAAGIEGELHPVTVEFRHGCCPTHDACAWVYDDEQLYSPQVRTGHELRLGDAPDALRAALRADGWVLA